MMTVEGLFDVTVEGPGTKEKDVGVVGIPGGVTAKTVSAMKTTHTWQTDR